MTSPSDSDLAAARVLLPKIISRRQQILDGKHPTIANLFVCAYFLRGSIDDDIRATADIVEKMMSYITGYTDFGFFDRIRTSPRDFNNLIELGSHLPTHSMIKLRCTFYRAALGSKPDIAELQSWINGEDSVVLFSEQIERELAEATIAGLAAGYGTDPDRVDFAQAEGLEVLRRAGREIIYPRALYAAIADESESESESENDIDVGQVVNPDPAETAHDRHQRFQEHLQRAIDEDRGEIRTYPDAGEADDVAESLVFLQNLIDDGPRKVVVPKFDIKSIPVRQRDNAKPFEPIAGAHLPLVKTPDLRDVADRLTARFPHFADEIQRVLRPLASRDTVELRVLLVGEPGCGKTELAKALATELALPWTYVSAAALADGSFAGTSAQWSTSRASVPLQLVGRHRTANPMVLLDELEKAGTGAHNGNFHDSLLPFLEPSSSAHIRDLSLELDVDLSAVCYIATANELDPIPDPLRDRFSVIRMPSPGPEHAAHFVPQFMHDIAAERGLDPRFYPPLAQDEIEVVETLWRGGSLRMLRKVVETMIDGREAQMGRC